MLKVIYSKFSNDRCPEYAIRTNIVRDENKIKYIQKLPMDERAGAHVKKLYASEKKLFRAYEGTVLEPNKSMVVDGVRVFEFVEGESLTKRLDMLSEKNDVDGFFALFDKYAALLEKVSKDVINIDLITDNIIIDGGRWVVIDYEWVTEEKTDSRFLLYRTLHYYADAMGGKKGCVGEEELYSHFGYDEAERRKWDEKEKEFQSSLDNGYHKLETFKYLYNRTTLDVNKLMQGGAGSGKEFDVLSKMFGKDEQGASVLICEKKQQISSSAYGELSVNIPLESGTEEVHVSVEKKALLAHVKSVIGKRGEDVALSYGTTGTPLGDNVVRLMEGESLRFFVGGEGFSALYLVLSLHDFDGKFEQAYIQGVETQKAEKDELLCRIENLQKQIESYENLMQIVNLRQEQINQLSSAKSIYYMGRSFEKLKGYDPVRALRPPLGVEESGIRFFLDEIQYRDYSLFIRGWAFHGLGHKVTIRVRDEKRRKIDTYVRKIVRDDVSDAFGIPVKTVCGFALSIDKKAVKTEKIYLEFETVGGYISKEIMAYGRKKDAEKRAGLLQSREDYRIEYDEWVRFTKITDKELKRQRKTKFDYSPLISVVVPLFNTPLDYLETMIHSVLHQTYSNVQLCLADGSSEDAVEEYVRAHYGNDSRVKYKRLAENKGISGNTIEAVSMAEGEFLMLCDHDDEVMPNACYEMVSALNLDREIDAVYTDEDKMTMDGKYFFDPHFKPDFNLNFLRSNNYICHIFLVRKSIVESIGETFRSRFDGAQDFDFILRCCEKARKVYHVPKVVYHWRSHPLSTAGNPESKDYAYEAGRAAVEASYERAGIPAKVTRTEYFGRYRTEFEVIGSPKVSVIVAADERETDSEKLKACIDSIYTCNRYGNFDVTVVCHKGAKEIEAFLSALADEKTGLSVITAEERAGSPELYKLGAKKAGGDYFLFLKGSAEAVSEEWMKELLSYCQLSDVGACGGKIIKKDGTIWSAGLVIGMHDSVGRAFEGLCEDEFSYAGWANSTRDVSAVSGVCIMTGRDVYEKLNGFDETMGEAFFDSDYCLRVIASGKRIVYNTYAKVRYEECGKEKQKETADAESRFKECWNRYFEKGDPYFNPNFSTMRSDCELKEIQ